MTSREWIFYFVGLVTGLSVAGIAYMAPYIN